SSGFPNGLPSARSQSEMRPNLRSTFSLSSRRRASSSSLLSCRIFTTLVSAASSIAISSGVLLVLSCPEKAAISPPMHESRDRMGDQDVHMIAAHRRDAASMPVVFQDALYPYRPGVCFGCVLRVTRLRDVRPSGWTLRSGQKLHSIMFRLPSRRVSVALLGPRTGYREHGNSSPQLSPDMCHQGQQEALSA